MLRKWFQRQVTLEWWLVWSQSSCLDLCCRVAFLKGRWGGQNSVFPPLRIQSPLRSFEFMMVEINFEAHWATSGLERRRAVPRAAGTETFMTSRESPPAQGGLALRFLAFIVIFRISVTGGGLFSAALDFTRYFPPLFLSPDRQHLQQKVSAEALKERRCGVFNVMEW